jgi:hypothetical protein
MAAGGVAARLSDHGSTSITGDGMTKGKSKGGGRNGSQSNNHSKAAPSDQTHDGKQVRERKSVKLGSVNAGKLEDGRSKTAGS